MISARNLIRELWPDGISDGATPKERLTYDFLQEQAQCEAALQDASESKQEAQEGTYTPEERLGLNAFNAGVSWCLRNAGNKPDFFEAQKREVEQWITLHVSMPALVVDRLIHTLTKHTSGAFLAAVPTDRLDDLTVNLCAALDRVLAERQIYDAGPMTVGRMIAKLKALNMPEAVLKLESSAMVDGIEDTCVAEVEGAYSPKSGLVLITGNGISDEDRACLDKEETLMNIRLHGASHECELGT